MVVKTRNINFFLSIFEKHILKHTKLFWIFAIFFMIQISSCKTCKCPAYSQNQVQQENQDIKSNDPSSLS